MHEKQVNYNFIIVYSDKLQIKHKHSCKYTVPGYSHGMQRSK